jgi:hypothetical protein
MPTNLFPPNAIRVELSTSNKANHNINEQTQERVTKYANSNPKDITSRIKKLDREWDTERLLEVLNLNNGMEQVKAIINMIVSVANQTKYY